MKHFTPEQYVFSWGTLCNDPVEHILLNTTVTMEAKFQWKTFFDTAQEIMCNSKQASETYIHIINLTGFYIHH